MISFLIILLGTIIMGCGGKAVLSDDAIRIRKTADFVNELKMLYEQGDERLLTMFSQEYFAEEPEIKTNILQDLTRFSNISLSLFIDRIEIVKERVNISIHWDGTWRDTEKTYREGGSAVLLTMLYNDSLRITDIKGDSPFGISGRLPP